MSATLTKPCQPPEADRTTPGVHWLKFSGETIAVRWEVWQDEMGWAFDFGFISPREAGEMGYEYLMSMDVPKLKRPVGS